MVQHNDYHFIIKQLVEELKRQFKCSGENTEKYITFSVPIKKEEDDDNGKKEEDDNGKKEEEDDNNSKKRKQLCTNQNLLIAIDLCKANYQTLSITDLELTARNTNHAWKETN